MKKIFALLAMAVWIFAGCSKDNEGGPVVQDDEIQFYLKITQQNEETRADAGQVANGTKVNFTEGAIFFADASDNFVRYVRITNDLVSGTVSAAELEKGYLFNGISNTAVRVYVVGGRRFTETSIKDKSALDAITVTLKDEADDYFGVSNATLAGSGEIVKARLSTSQINTSAPGFNASDYASATHEAYVRVRPLIARFEIKKITGIGIDDGWQLDGIYVDNFYYRSTLFGDYNNPAPPQWYEYPWTGKGSTYDKYNRLDPTSAYSTADWNPILFDDGSYNYSDGTIASGVTNLGTGTYPNSITPDNGSWAYNIFADAGNVPNIILALSNVKVDGTIRENKTIDEITGVSGSGDGIAFLTVTGYNNGGAPVTIEGGYVYVIDDLKFKAGGNNNGGDGEDNTRDEPKGPEDPDNPDPGDDKLDVFVQIELMDWTTVDVDVDFN